MEHRGQGRDPRARGGGESGASPQRLAVPGSRGKREGQRAPATLDRHRGRPMGEVRAVQCIRSGIQQMPAHHALHHHPKPIYKVDPSLGALVPPKPTHRQGRAPAARRPRAEPAGMVAAPVLQAPRAEPARMAAALAALKPQAGPAKEGAWPCKVRGVQTPKTAQT